MKEIIKRVKKLNSIRFTYLSLLVILSIYILALSLKIVSLQTGIEYQVSQFKALETKISVIYLLKYERFSEYLPPHSRMYEGYDTPKEVLSAFNFQEHTRKWFNCSVGTSGEQGCLQQMPRMIEHYCPDIDVWDIKGALSCADRILQANYKIKKDWWKVAFVYNCGGQDMPRCYRYADSIIYQISKLK